MRRLDLTGLRFGRLVVQERRPERISGRMYTKWLCKCDCGTSVVVVSDGPLKRGESQSCGCLQKEITSARRKSHGQSKTRVHGLWRAIKGRCNDSGNHDYYLYGARGIKMAPEWEASFEEFAKYVGKRPEGKLVSLDRIDNSKGYEPGNVRWATPLTQSRNRRTTIRLNVNDLNLCLGEAVQLSGLAYSTVYNRIFRFGWTPEQALSTPSRRRTDARR